MYFELYYVLKDLHVGHVEVLTVCSITACIKCCGYAARLLKGKIFPRRFRSTNEDKKKNLHGKENYFIVVKWCIYAQRYYQN